MSLISISETSTTICSGIAVGSASTVTSRVTCSSTPPSRTPGALSAPSSSIADLRLDLLVEANLEAVEMGDVPAHRVMLLLLDHDGDGLGAVDLEVEKRLALREDRAKLASRNLEGARLAALAVDDTWHQAVPAQAAGCPRAEYLARRDLECGSVLCHSDSALPRGYPAGPGYARAPG